MAFDATKVNLDDEELAAAAAADALFESFEDGFSAGDVVDNFDEVRDLFDYLYGDGTVDRFDLANRLLVLGFAFIRDNDVIDNLNVESAED